MTKKLSYIFTLFTLIILLFACVKNDSGKINNFYNYPNPFNPKASFTTFRLNYDTSDVQKIEWILNVYTENGAPVYSTTGNSTTISSPLLIQWDGRDNRGNLVQNGIYHSQIEFSITQLTSGYSGDTYTEQFYTVVQ